MKTKQLANPGNNGTPYFGVRILIKDQEPYSMVISYLSSKAIKKRVSEEDALKGRADYIFDKEGRQIARTNDPRGIVELTKEVNSDIKKEIEKIVMRYSE